MRRREFIAGLGGAAAWPLVAQAQQASIPLVGFLTSAGAAANARYLDAFRSGMLELGYVEVSNIRYEYRFADGHLDRLPELAVDLVRIKPNVIVSAPLPTHMALRQATSTIPIVMATGADPVGFGLVTSLSHPGGNVTGLTNFAEVLAAKQVDLLRELIPRLSRLGALVNVTNPLHVPQLQETKLLLSQMGST
jgi:putative ABC transport system substrate-binding protein